MKPFIIVGMPRTGSSLLRLSLACLPEIMIARELFHKLESERKNRHFIKKKKTVRYYYKGGDEYAWNEFVEGGWIMTTLTEGDKRVKAIKEVIEQECKI